MRKSKKVGTDETKYFIWSNGNMVYEFTATDDTAYFFGLHLISSDDYRYVLNAHGDVVALVNASGTVTKRYEYDAFGVELNPDENDENPYRYCAEYFDVESGTIYLRARYYNPAYGRFTQSDPHWNIGNRIYGDPDNTNADEEQTVKVYLPDILAIRQSGNLYVYGLSNPVCNIDPSGEGVASALIFIGITAVVVLIVKGCENQERSLPYTVVSSISVSGIGSMPQNVQNSYNGYVQNGWRNHSAQAKRTHAGGVWRNDYGALPTYNSTGEAITYQEFDVNDRVDGQRRDGERFLVGSDGSVYYTNDHYVTFIKIQ